MLEQMIVMPASPTPKARKRIAERVNASRCLCCERQPLKRGLCHRCYYKWRTTRQALASAEKRAAYDALLITSGRLLHSQAVRSLRSQTVFDQVAAEVDA